MNKKRVLTIFLLTASCILCLTLINIKVRSIKPRTSATPQSLDPEIVNREFLKRAAKLLKAARVDPGSAFSLIRALRHENDEIRQAAIASLASLGHKAKEGVPELLKMMTDSESAETRRLVMVALKELGRAAENALPAITAALQTEQDLYVRAEALRALGRIDSRGDSTGTIAALLEAPEAYLRESAAFALGDLGPPAAAAVPALKRLLQQEANPMVRMVAAPYALSMITPNAEEPVALLLEAIRSANPRERAGAAYALGHIQASAALPFLNKMAKSDPDLVVRRFAQEAAAAVQKGLPPAGVGID